MMFYLYSQNNSGGSFITDESQGIGEFVVVEAESADAADARAVVIGLYFDGCEYGKDCSCCGDRWHRAYDDGHEKPPTPELLGFFGGGCGFVHYLDGRVVRFPEKCNVSRPPTSRVSKTRGPARC